MHMLVSAYSKKRRLGCPLYTRKNICRFSPKGIHILCPVEFVKDGKLHYKAPDDCPLREADVVIRLTDDSFSG